MVTIREATKDDEPELTRVHVSSIRTLGATAYDDREVDAWAGGNDPRRYPIDDPDGRVVVAEVGDRIVGFGVLEVPSYEITAVYVAPEFAGRGLGTTLLSHLESLARERGITTLRLVASKNAVPFYRKGNWTPIGTCTQSMGIEGVELTCVEMEKRLDT